MVKSSELFNEELSLVELKVINDFNGVLFKQHPSW